MRQVTARRPRRRLWRLLRRGGWRVGLPVLLVAALFGAVEFAASPAGDAAWRTAEDRLIDGSAVFGLVVTDIRVEGRETTDRGTILAALAVERGTPILAVSPQLAKRRLESLPWVRSAAIERRLPDTIFVRLVERKPLAVWQHGGRIELIDRDGKVIPVKDLDAFARLPTVVGEDAPSRAAALIDMLASEPDLVARVSAAVWVGGRRWNLRIDRAIDVLLPEENAAGAWAQLAQMDRSNGLLKRDVQAVDLRLPDRLVLRLNPEPGKEPPPAKKGRLSAKST